MSDEKTESTPESTPEKAAATPDMPPMVLSVHPRSKHFNQEVLQRGVGIRFKGRQRTDIEEYSIPEGYVRVQAGKTVDRKGNPLLLKLKGPVEAWFEDLGDDAPVAKAD
ncbi:DUF3297 family protein [Qipengyuania sp. DSG2-2]|uniref:DUF3297 family protein n=1 Tax=Qipengyuania sp. DGS2-2 TaxID=3349631 RepID=UPI0036D249B9